MPLNDSLIYAFENFELDPARFELRESGKVLAVEPQVLSLLLLLASNSERLVSKDEVIEKVWNNRIVSEATVAARVMSARKALGDDGKAQRMVRTVHGRGFRFVGKVTAIRSRILTVSAKFQAAETPSMTETQKPSIAVIPFRVLGEAGANAFMADALADELIADLARLHWLFVIARGSTFRFRGQEVDCRDVGAVLGARYCLTGSLSFQPGGFSLAVELVDTVSGGVIWAETYSDNIGLFAEMRREIASAIVAALEIRVQSHEALAARSRSLEELDAWSAYHVGLDQMYRFNRGDNGQAAKMFQQAIDRSPDFARAYAGMSFTHFQNAFLNYGKDRSFESDEARRLAEKAVALDPFDPFGHFNMGRSFWLAGQLSDSLAWLERSIAICPNSAQSIYSRAWAETLSGHPEAGQADAQLALRLSPLDPLRYAMIATSALGEAIVGNYEEASRLAQRAARSPGAHKHIALIAAIAARLAGQFEASTHWLNIVQKADSHLKGSDFLRSFPFAQTAGRETIERALKDLQI